MSAAERSRRWRSKHPRRNREAQQRYRAQNPDKVAAQARGRVRPHDPTRISRHGQGIEADFATMWEQQRGQCYLCGIYLVPERAYVDHDHRCCPPRKSCSRCRRGLTCDYCNSLIGFALDDPATLRLIADNLEAKLAVMDARFTLEATS